MDYNSERQSLFNAGVAMAERIDALQRALNAARFNPLAFNPGTGTYNFEIMIRSCDGLISEAIGKMNDKEKESVKLIQQIIIDYQKFYPIFRNTKDGLKINMTNWEKLYPLIKHYEIYSKGVLDNHNFNSPDFDSDDGL